VSMRLRFLLVPPALIASAGIVPPASAKVFLSLADAQRLMYPRETLAQRFSTLTDAQAHEIARESRAEVHDKDIRAWQASSGGWFFIDRVYGKDDWITYAVALTADGSVRQIEILECLADYDTITMPEWRAQFIGRKAGDKLLQIETISGSTLSSQHITEGVRRVLTTHAHLFKNKN
jgi:hypothetical protein